VDRRLIGALWPTGRSTGAAVTPTGTGMSVQAAPGSVAVPAPNQTGSVLCAWDAPEVVNLNPSPPAGTNRIDLIVCQANGQDIDGGTVDAFVITFTAGADAPAGSEVAPAVPAGAVALAQVSVKGGAAAIVAGDITDARPGNLAVPPTPFAPVSFRAIHTAQSIPRITWTNITAYSPPAENVGGGGFAAGKYTFPATGRYLVVANLMWQIPATTGAWGMQLQYAHTGSGGAGGGMSHLYLVNPANSNSQHPVAVLTATRQAGDTIQLQAYNGHPSAAVPIYPGYSWMAIDRIG
jgi:hypothetical protein